MNTLINLSPDAFIAFLKEHHIRRFYFVYDFDENRVRTSHTALQPIAEFLQNDRRDFNRHEGIFCQLSRSHDVVLAAFVHKTVRGQGAGGVRFWSYDTVEDFLRDGLRLAMGMTRKNALAGLWWGGGKGVILRSESLDFRDPKVREAIFQEYGEFITSLKGCYVTAEDVGTFPTDMVNIFSRTRFVTCIPESLGGSGNPSIATARGVVKGMEAALHFLGRETLAGKTVCVQGLGHVGTALVGFLFEKGVAKIIASDIFPERIEAAKKQFGDRPFEARLVQRDDLSILFEPCDIVSPCATGAILNERTIPQIRAKIICGAANNQLEDPDRDDALLMQRGIWYVPDFLVNRMGIVNCANEQYGYVDPDPAIERHLGNDWEHSIFQSTLQVFRAAKSTGEPPGEVATRIADGLAEQPHPIFGHRGKQIIDSLIRSGWHEGGEH